GSLSPQHKFRVHRLSPRAPQGWALDSANSNGGNRVMKEVYRFVTFAKVILVLACLMPGALLAQEAKVTPVLSKDLTNLPGKEGLMLIVEYPPGSSDQIHRHNAHGFIYVLEGS